MIRRLICVVVLLLSSSPAAAQDEPDPRTLRVERWLKAVLHHQPGEVDAAAEEVARWSQGELRELSLDTWALALLMRDPRSSWFTVRTAGQRTSQTVRYTPRQLERMRILMCAAAGIVKERFCMQRKALAQLDDDLLRLGELAARSRRQGDSNYVLRRGALLHTDVAISPGAEVFEEISPRTTGASQRITISIEDGRGRSTYAGVIHWEIARTLLDAVRPTGDPMVRRWYRATAAWMQARGYHENTDHLVQGRRLFPKDADLLFLSGCEHESFARPSVQAAVRSVVLPPGLELVVKSDETELREAENFFRQALAANPDLLEARLRLGRVLLLRERPLHAADELRRTSAAVEEDVMKYFVSLFLGAAEEALGNYDAADRLYTAASALYPTAQSPHIARSALARRRGDRQGALRGIERVFRLAAAHPGSDDPWWTYDRAAGRNGDELIDELRRPFREAEP